MATFTVQDTTLDGDDVTLSAVDAGGDDFANTGREYFEVANGSGSPITVTFNAPNECSQGFTHDVQVTVASGATERIGPFSTARFGDSVAVTYSSATSVTAAAVRV